ncbi:MAG: PRTRC system ThiF family protein [Acidobacteria bacterium]|nr:PRTRC system ThiF family protein [Acidobacteriota bacterium]
MIVEHALPKSLCRRGQPLRVLIVGAGGNGSAMLLGLPYLHQAMKVWGHAGGIHVMLADGDLVSETNCVRQPFASADVGLNKAIVLINRVNLFWGLRWQAHPEHFHKDSLRSNSPGPHLIIGCVDTRAARQAILSAVTRANDSTVYWLDLGNNACSGQYVLGQPLNAANHRTAVRLRTVAELYPEIADAEAGEDPLPSCSAAEALERQEPFINQVLATSALAMLARLFRYGTLTHHGAFYNASTGRTSVLGVDPYLWKKIQKRTHRTSLVARKKLR